MDKEIKDTREAILACSLRLFATRGYHLTKVSDIVRESHCAQATFYWHFKSKLDMTLELLAEGQDAIVAVINQGYRDQIVSIEDMIANTRRWLVSLLEFARENRYLMAILLVRGYGADPAVDERIALVHRAIYDSLYRNISRAVALGMLPADGDPAIRTAFVHQLIEGTISWWLFGTGKELDHVSTIGVESVADQLAAFEFHGLKGDRTGQNDAPGA
jgi:AcrR family transcriptional regulator